VVLSPKPAYDDEHDPREWDSPHCCSCCCACCACHKISRAFWYVTLLTVTVFALAVGLLIDGFVKQSNCSVDYSDPNSSDEYDDCRQKAFVQLIAACALGGVFLLLLFVCCCAFMDVCCFRRCRSRPHLRPHAHRRSNSGSANVARYDPIGPPPQASFRNLHVQTHGAGNGAYMRQVPMTQPHAVAYQHQHQQHFMHGPNGTVAGGGHAMAYTPQPQHQQRPGAMQQLHPGQELTAMQQQHPHALQQQPHLIAPHPAHIAPRQGTALSAAMAPVPAPAPAGFVPAVAPRPVGFAPTSHVQAPQGLVAAAPNALSPMPTLGERLRQATPARENLAGQAVRPVQAAPLGAAAGPVAPIPAATVVPAAAPAPPMPLTEGAALPPPIPVRPSIPPRPSLPMVPATPATLAISATPLAPPPLADENEEEQLPQHSQSESGSRLVVMPGAEGATPAPTPAPSAPPMPQPPSRPLSQPPSPQPGEAMPMPLETEYEMTYQ